MCVWGGGSSIKLSVPPVFCGLWVKNKNGLNFTFVKKSIFSLAEKSVMLRSNVPYCNKIGPVVF